MLSDSFPAAGNEALLGGKVLRKSNSYGYRQNRNQFNDPFFAGLFFLNTVFVFAFSMVYGVIALSGVSSKTVTVNDSGSHHVWVDSDISGEFVGGVSLVSAIAGSLSMFMVYMLSKYSDGIIVSSLITIVIISMVIGIGMISYGIIAAGFAIVVFAIASGLFLYYIRPRIGFASVNLRIACEAISCMPKIFAYAAGVMGVLFLWCLVWAMAVYGVATNATVDTIHAGGATYSINQCTTYVYGGDVTLNGIDLNCAGSSCRACFCESDYIRASSCFTEKFFLGYYFVMLVSLFWACSVFSNVVHCTTAGAVASWWRSEPLHFDAEEASTSSFLTTMLNDFGSICLGSLFVALLKGMRSATQFFITQLRQYKESYGGSKNPLVSISATLGVFVASGLVHVLLAVEYLLEYFNRYAFTYVSLYGYSFTDASKAVLVLFKERGWDAIINDDVIDSVLFFWNITIGMLTMACGLIFGRYVGMSVVDDAVFCAISFAIGYAIGLISLKIVMAAVAAIYVMFAEFPEVFEQCHPALYYELMASWEELYPAAMRRGAREDGGGAGEGEARRRWSGNQHPQHSGYSGVPTTGTGTAGQEQSGSGTSSSTGSIRGRLGEVFVIPGWAKEYLTVLMGRQVDDVVGYTKGQRVGSFDELQHDFDTFEDENGNSLGFSL